MADEDHGAALLVTLERATQRGHPPEAMADLISGATLRHAKALIAALARAERASEMAAAVDEDGTCEGCAAYHRMAALARERWDTLSRRTKERDRARACVRKDHCCLDTCDTCPAEPSQCRIIVALADEPEE